jgi:RNA polymerase sigma-70 factor (ECF subfamily)
MRQDMIRATTFETIYAQHAAEVHRAAHAILRDAALAEDVVQEVFERVWRGSGYDERRGPLGPYLTMLARSRVLDSWRRTRAAERVQHRLESQAGTLPAGTHEPEASLVRAAEHGRARAAVRRLPDEQRKAIGLVYWGGLSAAELAAVDGVPLGTAKSRVRLGLAKLSRDPELAAA